MRRYPHRRGARPSADHRGCDSRLPDRLQLHGIRRMVLRAFFAQESAQDRNHRLGGGRYADPWFFRWRPGLAEYYSLVSGQIILEFDKIRTSRVLEGDQSCQIRTACPRLFLPLRVILLRPDACVDSLRRAACAAFTPGFIPQIQTPLRKRLFSAIGKRSWDICFPIVSCPIGPPSTASRMTAIWCLRVGKPAEASNSLAWPSRSSLGRGHASHHQRMTRLTDRSMLPATLAGTSKTSRGDGVGLRVCCLNNLSKLLSTGF